MSYSTHDNTPHISGDTEDPASAPTWLVALASSILVIVTVLAVVALYYGAERREQHHKVTTVRSQEWGLMREARRLALMQDPHWEQWTDADGVLAGEKSLIVPIDVERGVVLKRWGPGGSGHPVEPAEEHAEHGDGH